MIVVACVAIIVVGPKDLPKMLRAFGKTVRSVRKMAGDFQRQFDDAIREAELDDLKNVASPTSFKPLDDVKQSAEKIREQMEAEVAQNTSAAAAKKAATEEKSAAAKPTKTAAKRKPAAARSATAAKKAPAKKAPGKPAAKRRATKAAASKPKPSRAKAVEKSAS